MTVPDGMPVPVTGSPAKGVLALLPRTLMTAAFRLVTVVASFRQSTRGDERVGRVIGDRVLRRVERRLGRDLRRVGHVRLHVRVEECVGRVGQDVDVDRGTRAGLSGRRPT